MAETLESIVRSLKTRAEERDKALFLKLGNRKLALPFKARVLVSEEYLFVHVPSDAAIFCMREGNLEPVERVEEAQKAQRTFPRRSRGKKEAPASELPPKLAEALREIPAGYRLAYDRSGQPRLVRMRKRRGSAAIAS